MALTKLTQNLIDGTLVTSVNSLTGAVTLETGTDWVNTIQTSNFTAVAGKGYFVNTTSSEITVTLPAGAVGNEVIIQDYAGTFGTNKVIVSANGSEKIQGSTDNVQNTINNSTITLVYQDVTKGWTADNISVYGQTLAVQYLVVAGGGGGGSAGGGGAGGLLTGTHTFSPATNYNLTIGGAGAGSTGGGGYLPGTNGSDTIISGLYTADGGGGGGRYIDPGTSDGLSGGSGGGGGWPASSGGSATAGQGNDGGASTGSTSPNIYAAAGGGGAGATGASDSGTDSGDGGIGVASSITGTAYYWAGGGGGGNQVSSSAAGNGGNGGGGGGAQYYSTSTAGIGGTGLNTGGTGTIHQVTGSARGGSGGDNTGGGGGGMAISVTTGGGGGSGIIILRYPNIFTLTNPGGGLTTTIFNGTVGSDKYTTFTGGTGNIQLN